MNYRNCGVLINIDDDIKQAERDFNYYLRNRQKYIDNPKKFSYYNSRLLVREERLYLLLMKRLKKENGYD